MFANVSSTLESSRRGSFDSHSLRRGSLAFVMTGLPCGSHGTGLPCGEFSGVAGYTSTGTPRSWDAPQIQHCAYLSIVQLMFTSSKPCEAVSISGYHQAWFALTVPSLMP